MISGKAFADGCSWVQDPRYPARREFYSQFAKDGEWVFVNGDVLDVLLGKFPTLPVLLGKLPALRAKRFHIVIHNSDRPFGQSELESLLPRAYHIYAVNAIVSHPQLTPIPLGFRDCTLDFLRDYRPETLPRTIEVYGNFKVCNNATKRAACKKALANDPRVVWREETDFAEYLHDLCQSKFVLCPEGTGIDTHRVYEALLCGATPVVLHSPLDALYRRFPICIVKDWTDPFSVPEGSPSFDIGFFLRK